MPTSRIPFPPVTCTDASIAVDTHLEGSVDGRYIVLACRDQGANRSHRLNVEPARGKFQLKVRAGESNKELEGLRGDEARERGQSLGTPLRWGPDLGDYQPRRSCISTRHYLLIRLDVLGVRTFQQCNTPDYRGILR